MTMDKYRVNPGKVHKVQTLPILQIFGGGVQSFSVFPDVGCVWLRLREFNLHMFVGPSMHLDALYPDSQCLLTILVNYIFCWKMTYFSEFPGNISMTYYDLRTEGNHL